MLLALALANATPAGAETLVDLAKHTHFHGIAFAQSGSAEFLLATHHGIFAVSKDGDATPVSPVHDFMGFSADPSNPLAYYASGHPAAGGNSGFLKSVDGGANWKQLSAGSNGPVDFHQMDVSGADPKTIYGNYRGLQVSHDSGANWSAVGAAPDQLIAIAASSLSADQIYAATQQGLMVSPDAGKSWKASAYPGEIISLVKAAPHGVVYAFVLHKGLMTFDETAGQWNLLSNAFGEDVPMHLAIDGKNGQHLALTTIANAVLESADGGKTWVQVGK